jgi:hypothetical protein
LERVERIRLEKEADDARRALLPASDESCCVSQPVAIESNPVKKFVNELVGLYPSILAVSRM